MKDNTLKSEFRKDYAIVLADGLDLEKVYKDQESRTQISLEDVVSKEALRDGLCVILKYE
jgi:hypothetical protein